MVIITLHICFQWLFTCCPLAELEMYISVCVSHRLSLHRSMESLLRVHRTVENECGQNPFTSPEETLVSLSDSVLHSTNLDDRH